MKNLLTVAALAIASALCSCSGSRSTVKDGYAYEMTRADANSLVKSVIQAYVAPERILPTGELVASGYTRLLTDTQTYTLTAIPFPARNAYGLEVTHRGTMFDGPATASRIFEDAKRRANLLGPRVPIP